MKPMHKNLLNTLLLVLAVGYGAPAAAEIAIIAHPSNGTTSLNSDQVQRIFLGKMASFPGGGRAVPVDQTEGSPVRKNFYSAVVGKSESEAKAYWSRLIFTGKGQPPEVVGDDQAVKGWVAGHAEGIGYIDAGAVDGSVKVLLTVP